MLFSLMPAWAVIVVLALVLLGKSWVIGRIEKTPFYHDRMVGKGWMAVTNVIAGLNGLVTAALLLIPAGLFWAIVLGIVDAAIHWLVGYWKVKKMWPRVDAGNIAEGKELLTKAGKWVLALHGASYLSISAYVVDFVSKHPEWTSQLLALLHLS